MGFLISHNRHTIINKIYIYIYIYINSIRLIKIISNILLLLSPYEIPYKL